MKKDFLEYLLALLLFGSNGIVASFISLSSEKIVLLRTLIGSVFLLAVFLISKGKFTFFRYKKDSLFLLLSGICMGLSWMFLYEAYGRIGVGVASLCYYCGPVAVMMFSPLIFHEKFTVSKIVGFSVVVIGIVLLNSNSFSGGGDRFGVFCGLMSAVMYAGMVIFNKKAERIKGFENAVLQLAVSFLASAVFVIFREGFHISLSGGDIIPILILGLLNTGAGCYFYFSSIGGLKVQTVAVCGYLEPLSAVIFSVLFLHERLLAVQILGAVMIISGAVFSEFFKVKKRI